MSQDKTRGYEREKENQDQSQREKGTQTPPRPEGGNPALEGQERVDHDLRPQTTEPHSRQDR